MGECLPGVAEGRLEGPAGCEAEDIVECGMHWVVEITPAVTVTCVV